MAPKDLMISEYKRLGILPRQQEILAQLQYPIVDTDGITEDGHVTSISLIKKELTTLPESIGELTSLQTLVLNYNNLKTLPESFGNLSNLTRANLDHNRLVQLPESFGMLTNLFSLSLENNDLTSLCKSFGNLHALTRLYISHNKLVQLPEYFGDLRSLRDLRISHNKLVRLCKSIGKLKSLGHLYLNHNKLSSLPETFGDLSNLGVLILNNNRFKQIPEIIGKASNLVHIHLQKNQLSYLPESWSKLIKLKHIFLEGNPLLSLYPITEEQLYWNSCSVLGGRSWRRDNFFRFLTPYARGLARERNWAELTIYYHKSTSILVTQLIQGQKPLTEEERIRLLHEVDFEAWQNLEQNLPADHWAVQALWTKYEVDLRKPKAAQSTKNQKAKKI
jgi:Leucine-rich repeat (LRR) protein